MSIGSEVSGGIENITVRDIFFDNANQGAYLKYSSPRGGYLRNIHFENVRLATIKSSSIVITSAYGENNPSCPKVPVHPQITEVSNVSFTNFTQVEGTSSKHLLDLNGLEGHNITGVSLADINLKYAEAILHCQYASGVYHNAPGAELCAILKPL